MNRLKRFWGVVSNIGIDNSSGEIPSRTTILSNQFNFTLFLIMLILSIFLKALRVIDDRSINIGGYRFFWMMGMSVIHLMLAYKRKHTLAKVMLIFSTPILFLIIPAMMGFVEDQSFFYYSSIVIAFSLFPQLLVSPKKQPVLYVISMIYYFVLLVGLEYVLLYYAPAGLAVIPMIKGFWIFYKTATITIFLFVNSSVFYFKWINHTYEHQLIISKQELEANNQKLDIHLEKLRTTNQHLKATQQQLVHSEKMASLGVLTAGVAHEINTPLNFIATGSLLLKNALEDINVAHTLDDACNSQLTQGYEIIDKGIDQASFIVSSLMTFSYNGKSVKQYHSITKIIDSTLLFLKGKMPADIEIEKRFELNHEIPVYADKVHQVFVNIINNALDELREMPQKVLSIHTYTSNDRNQKMATISIFNKGRQITDEIGQCIFDPFFTTKSITQGTGLGLSLSYNLMKEHNGHIYYVNHEDGVEFIVQFPVEA